MDSFNSSGTLSVSATAERAAAAFSRVLADDEVPYWSLKVKEVAELLSAGKADAAIHHWQLFRLAGPGSLSDVSVKDEQLFHSTWRDFTVAMIALRKTAEAR